VGVASDRSPISSRSSTPPRPPAESSSSSDDDNDDDDDDDACASLLSSDDDLDVEYVSAHEVAPSGRSTADPLSDDPDLYGSAAGGASCDYRDPEAYDSDDDDAADDSAAAHLADNHDLQVVPAIHLVSSVGWYRLLAWRQKHIVCTQLAQGRYPAVERPPLRSCSTITHQEFWWSDPLRYATYRP